MFSASIMILDGLEVPTVLAVDLTISEHRGTEHGREIYSTAWVVTR